MRAAAAAAALPGLAAGCRCCRKLQLGVPGLCFLPKPSQIRRQRRREQRSVLRSPGLRANRPPPQISTGKAEIWQLHPPWRKTRQACKSQESLDLLARPREMSGFALLRRPTARPSGHCTFGWVQSSVTTGAIHSLSLAEPNERPNYQSALIIIILIPN